MNARSLTAKLVLLALVLPAVGSAQRIVSWTDENGVRHYGDRVPPEYANRDRDLLNSQGVVVGRQQSLTDEQRAEQERLAAEEEARQKQAQYDKMLVQSYTRIEEIEAARDRRLAELDSQIANTEKALEELRARLAQQQRNAGRYKPYSSDPGAPDLPTTLASNIKQSEKSIAEFEATLASFRADRASTVETFAADIRRFKELKNL